MSKKMKIVLTLGTIALFGTLLAACGSSEKNNAASNGSTPAASPSATVSASPSSDPAASVRKITDYIGHEIEIPVSPERVVFVGETFSDLLALGVKAIGTSTSMASETVYEDQLAGIEDVGFPINLEKIISLAPDLVIIADTDEKVYEQLSKIAPTIVFDTFAPLEERLPLLGDVLGKKTQAEQWLAEYNKQEDQMWKELQAAGLKPGETASVFTYYPGERLFVMARTGLSQVLYTPDGLKPTEPIQKVLDRGFEQISTEMLPEYAGDRIFILNPASELKDAIQSTEDLLKSRIWQDLPAVKAGHVYRLDIKQSGSDALSRQWLIEQLPKLMAK
ncbi:ABC transporter substrate-binding protein [Cohnella sp. LGH]|uniref:ABC transporter substrate-binding protein n=1 Tax=Cohnella sp. LGH TaxID=1619153 RepID=UPI001ADC26A3|nr:ABC transporter substrate-binding protein [Cohnella sp. LGH]QTH45917.1 ABC transporter substrate-binding protein [Cohnella sp. LGH]